MVDHDIQNESYHKSMPISIIRCMPPDPILQPHAKHDEEQNKADSAHLGRMIPKQQKAGERRNPFPGRIDYLRTMVVSPQTSCMVSGMVSTPSIY
ncbi:MAG: hypothetical protein MJ136_02890, partial [Clostridia bacterium]|nr:hypothetical protein [Clostridia bacterium]